jgi:DNA-binding GntR family transcriptional regulator
MTSPLAAIQLDRDTLGKQAWEHLRDLIVRGKLQPGQKLTERDVSQQLGVSRMPARDALMKLEEQGLVVTKGNARYVIELKAVDIQNLFEIRCQLELLAVDAAIRNATKQETTRLTDLLAQMKLSVKRHDETLFKKSDLDIHEAIWGMSKNPYISKMLQSISGPVFMFIDRHVAIQENWEEVLDLHSKLITAICSDNSSAARKAMRQHMDNSLALSLRAFDQRS